MDEKNQLHTFVCASGSVGRFVKISTKNQRLHLCEVLVLSKSAASAWQCGTLPNMESWGAYDGACYHGSQEALPWFSANTHCRMSGAALPSLIDKAEQNYLGAQLNHRSPADAQFFWIGLVSSTTDRTWRWLQGELLKKENAFWSDSESQNIVENNPSSSYGVTLAKTFDWTWLPALQALWYHWICKSKPLFCSSPGVPKGGGVMLSSQSYGIGTSAYYYCNYGYALTGSETRICMENGTWSASVPSCSVIDCGAANPTLNGYQRLLNGSTQYGNLVEYRCQLGYKLTGRALRVCHADGAWSGQTPKCVVIDCGLPESTANGTYVLSKNSTRMGAVAEYVCDSDFRLVGSAVRHCSESAIWSPDAPACYDAASLRQATYEEDGKEPVSGHWQHQTNLMTGFIVAVVIILVLIFLTIFWMWKKKKLYDTFSMSTLYAAPTASGGGSSIGGVAAPKDVLYAYTNPQISTSDEHSSTYYSTVPVGDKMLLSVQHANASASVHERTTLTSGAARQESIYQSSRNRRISMISAQDLYYRGDEASSSSGGSGRGSADSEEPPMGASARQTAAIQPSAQESVALTELEIPPELLRLEQLPNGNYHLTLPCLKPGQRPGVRARGAIPFKAHTLRPSKMVNRLPSTVQEVCSQPGTPRTDIGHQKRLPRRPPRQKKFQTMVNNVRKKINQTSQTLRVTGHERQRPSIATIGAPIRHNLEITPGTLISTTNPHLMHFPSTSDARNMDLRPPMTPPRPHSPTPTELLFSFDYDTEYEEDVDADVTLPDDPGRSESSPGGEDNEPKIYDTPPEHSKTHIATDSGYLKSRSLVEKQRRFFLAHHTPPTPPTYSASQASLENESNIYEDLESVTYSQETSEPGYMTLEHSGLEMAHTHC